MLNDMDVAFVVQCVGERKEVVRVEEVVTIEIVDDVRDEAFLGASVHSGRVHNNFGYRNRKQSRRVISISLVVRYRPYFF